MSIQQLCVYIVIVHGEYTTTWEHVKLNHFVNSLQFYALSESCEFYPS